MNGVLATRSAARTYFCGQAWRGAGAILKGPTTKTFSNIAIASPAVIGAMALSLMAASPADAQSRYRDRDRDRDNDRTGDVLIGAAIGALTAAERLTRGYGVAETRCLAFVYDKITPQSATVIMITTTIGKSTSNT